MQTQKKLLNLESLRGIAALSVTLFHFDAGSHFNNEFVANAWLMVDFFFVLSGFVISLNYQSRIDSVTNLFHFQYKRFLRLYPLHLLMLMAFLGIEVARYFAEVQFNMVTSSRAFSENNFISFIANIFLLQNWTQSSLTWNFPSWSISAEFYTYAIFGLTVLLSQKYKLLMSVVSILFVLGAGSILLEKGMGTDYVTGPSRCIYSFFIGVLTFNICNHFDLMGKIQNSFSAILLLAVSVSVVVLLDHSRANQLAVFVPLVFALTVLVVVSTNESTMINTVLGNQYLVYLGTISYGIYMVHAAIWYVLRQTLRFGFQLPVETDSEGKVSVVFGNIYLADIVVIIGVALIVLTAHLSYRFIETKFNLKRQKVSID